LQKYTGFLIDLLSESNDTDMLLNLCRKLRKAAGVFLDHTGIMTKARDVMLMAISKQAKPEDAFRLPEQLAKTTFEEYCVQVIEAIKNEQDEITESYGCLQKLQELVKICTDIIDAAPVQDVLAKQLCLMMHQLGMPLDVPSKDEDILENLVTKADIINMAISLNGNTQLKVILFIYPIC
jgi:hypothetical protein